MNTKKIGFWGAFLATVVLAGCATSHDTERVRMNSYMSKTKAPVKYTETARPLIYSKVRDPSSTIINYFSGPKPGAFTPFMGDEFYGYVVCYNVNTKNILRTYTGNRLYLYMFEGEKVVLEAVQSGLDPVTDKRIAAACTKAL